MADPSPATGLLLPVEDQAPKEEERQATQAPAAPKISVMPPTPAASTADQPKTGTGLAGSESTSSTSNSAAPKPDAVATSQSPTTGTAAPAGTTSGTPPAACPTAAGQPDDGVGVLEFKGSVDSNNELPTRETLRKIEDYTVQDRHGKTCTFRSLYNSKHAARRVLIIFVRHFFCGNCQDYLRTLSASPITPARLLQLPVTTSIAVVGCGDPSLIDMYAAATGCEFPIYADPTRRLYESLGMVRTLQAGERPHYQSRSLLRNSLESIAQGLSFLHKGLATKGGDFRQIGGEFLFEPVRLRGRDDVEGWGDVDRQMERAVSVASSAVSPTNGGGGGGGDAKVGAEQQQQQHGDRRDPSADHKPSLDGKQSPMRGRGDEDGDEEVEEKHVTWCHRMKTTRDHAEMPELMEVLGLGKDGHQQMLPGSRSASFGDKEKKRWSRAVEKRKGPELSNLSRDMGAMTTGE